MAIASFSYSAGGNLQVGPTVAADQFIRVFGYRVSGTSPQQVSWGYLSAVNGGTVTPIDGPHNLGDPTHGARPMVVESQGEEAVFDLPAGCNLFLMIKNATQVSGSVTYSVRQNL